MGLRARLFNHIPACRSELKLSILKSLSIVETVKEASAVCRSFLDGVVIFIFVGFHFFGHKMLQTHNFLDLKFSGSKFLLNSEFLWTQNHFLTQNYFDPKNVTPKEGFVQNTFWKKNYGANKFGPKKISWTNIFFNQTKLF